MRSAKAITTALILYAAMPPAFAGPITIGIMAPGVNGGSITTVATGNGSVAFSGTYGGFTITSANVSGPSGSQLDSSVDVAPNAIGAFSIYFTEQNITTTLVGSNLSINIGPGGNGGTAAIYYDTANGLFTTASGPPFGTTHLVSSLGSSGGVSMNANLSNFVQTVSGPYSITEVYTVNLRFPAPDSSMSIAVGQPALNVPEPATLALFTIAAGSIVALRRRRRQQSAKNSSEL